MADKKPIVLAPSGDLQQIQAGDTIPVANGGTGATTGPAALTNLGGQAADPTLTALAGLDASAGIIVQTAADTFLKRSLVPPVAGVTIANPDGAGGNPTFALADDLAALENLTLTGYAVRSATSTWVVRSITVVDPARLVVTNGDGVAGNTTLDLATVTPGAVVPVWNKHAFDVYGRRSNETPVTAADVSTLVDTRYVRKDQSSVLGNGVLISLNSATVAFGDDDLVPKRYVDGVAAGMDWKASVRAATTVAGTLSSSFANGQSIDGVTLATGDRILIKNQAAGQENGIYVVNASGAPTRAADANNSGEITGGMTVWVNQGTINADSGWTLITDDNPPIVIDTTVLVFTQSGGSGTVTAGAGLTKTGNTLDVVGTAGRIVANADSIDLATSGVTVGTHTKVTVDAYGRVTVGGTATPADVGAQPLDADLTALAGVSGTGMYAITGAGTSAVRNIAALGAGLVVTNGSGVAGDPTVALADDVAALEALGSTGFAARINTNTWAQRSITGAAGRTTITNGDGVSGNPIVDLASGVVAPGTYGSVTVDTYGRVTSGTAPGAVAQLGISLTNGTVSTINKLKAVYKTAVTDQIALAIANNVSTMRSIGFTLAGINAGAPGTIVTDGVVTGTTVEWDAVTGQSGGLTPGSVYFVSNATAGNITTTVPSSGFVVKAGIAMSLTQLLIQRGEPIQL